MATTGRSGGSTVAQRCYRIEGLHRVLPWPVAASLMKMWAGRVWQTNQRIRTDALRHMRFLLGPNAREAEVEAAARRYVTQTFFRVERWYRPWLSTKRPPEGVGALRATVDSGRGAIVNFLHYGEIHAPIGAIARAGIPIASAIDHRFFGPASDPIGRQIVRTLTVGGGAVFAAKGSSNHVRALLKEGTAVAIASDVTSGTFISVLGRQVGVASGAARLAKECGVPIFPLVATAIGRHPRWRLDAPIEPADYEDVVSLVQEMMRRHEPGLRHWPETLEKPLRRWTPTPEVARLISWSPEEPFSI